MKFSLRNKLTPERLQEVIDYNPLTGIFTWRCCRGKRMAGDVAGTMNKDGYTRIRIDGIDYLAHRLAFLFMTRNYPLLSVDHIDRNKSNNKWENLRDVHHCVNLTNTPIPRNNRSGVKGVIYNKAHQKWEAYITHLGVRYHLGYFCTLPDAEQERKEADQRRIKNPLVKEFTRVYKDNPSVNIHYRKGHYEVSVYRQGKANYLGSYLTEEEARNTRDNFLQQQSQQLN